jgi:hypothetical protein
VATVALTFPQEGGENEVRLSDRLHSKGFLNVLHLSDFQLPELLYHILAIEINYFAIRTSNYIKHEIGIS